MAGDRGAELEQVLADRRQVIHCIEREDAVDVSGRELQDARHLFGRLLRDPSPGLLRHPEDRKERGLLGRIALEDPVDALSGLRREDSRLAGGLDAIPPGAHPSNAPFFQLEGWPPPRMPRKSTI